VGKICPLVIIGLTELPNSGWAKAQPSHKLAAYHTFKKTCNENYDDFAGILVLKASLVRQADGKLKNAGF
jgi:hypothetical protein